MSEVHKKRHRELDITVSVYDYDNRRWKSFTYKVPCIECTPEEIASNLAEMMAEEWRKRSGIRKPEIVESYKEKMEQVLLPLIQVRMQRGGVRYIATGESELAERINKLMGRLLIARELAPEDWALGISTNRHILLDFDDKTCDCLRQAVALGVAISEEYGGRFFIVETDRGFHLYTTAKLRFRQWKAYYIQLLERLEEFPCVDPKHVKATINRDYVTLRVAKSFRLAAFSTITLGAINVRQDFFDKCSRELEEFGVRRWIPGE